jgi:hypothetical protein
MPFRNITCQIRFERSHYLGLRGRTLKVKTVGSLKSPVSFTERHGVTCGKIESPPPVLIICETARINGRHGILTVNVPYLCEQNELVGLFSGDAVCVL